MNQMPIAPPSPRPTPFLASAGTTAVESGTCAPGRAARNFASRLTDAAAPNVQPALAESIEQPGAAGGKVLPVVAGNELPDAEERDLAATAEPALVLLAMLTSGTVPADLPPVPVYGGVEGRDWQASGSALRQQLAAAPGSLSLTQTMPPSLQTPSGETGEPAIGSPTSGARVFADAGSAPSASLPGSEASSTPRLFLLPSQAQGSPDRPSTPMMRQDVAIPTADLLRSKSKIEAGAEAGPAANTAIALIASGEPTATGRSRARQQPVSEPGIATGANLADLVPAAAAGAKQPSAPPGMSTAAGASASPQPTSQPLDFEALIDRLTQARTEAAGRVEVSLIHRDFGPVAIRFEHAAGFSLASAALSSADPAFAPAAHAALAERGWSERHPQPADPAGAHADQSSARGESSTSHGQPHAHDAAAQRRVARQPPAEAADINASSTKFGESGEAAHGARPAGRRGLFA